MRHRRIQEAKAEVAAMERSTGYPWAVYRCPKYDATALETGARYLVAPEASRIELERDGWTYTHDEAHNHRRETEEQRNVRLAQSFKVMAEEVKRELSAQATDRAVQIGLKMADRVFARRGHKTEVHFTKLDLAALLAVAAQMMHEQEVQPPTNESRNES